MEEWVGSFIADEDGTLRPNLDDEAMRKRKQLEKFSLPKDEEVTDDGECGTQIPDPGQDRDDL
jgi:hypothetical protein